MKSKLKSAFLSLVVCMSMNTTYASQIPGIESVQEHEVTGLGTVRVGQELAHAKFGVGKVNEIHLGDAGVTMINITFPSFGSKWLMAEHANLKKVTE